MKVEHHQPTPKSGSKPRALGPVVPCVLERRPNNQRSRVSEEDALGVVLIAAAALGVLVSAHPSSRLVHRGSDTRVNSGGRFGRVRDRGPGGGRGDFVSTPVRTHASPAQWRTGWQGGPA